MTVRNVLIALDSSELSEQIVPVVRHLFEPAECQLTLLTVVPPLETYTSSSAELMSMTSPLYASAAYPAAGEHENWEQYRRGASRQLQQKAEQLTRQGYTTTPIVRVGDPVPEIVACAQEGDYDVLAMATHGRTGLSRLVLGSVVEQVLRLAPIPLLLIRPTADDDAETTTPGAQLSASLANQNALTIAVATDGSAHGRHATQLAGQLAHAMNASWKLLIIADPHEGVARAQHLMQEMRAAVRDLTPQPEMAPLAGYADDVVGRYLAEHPADLLVIGAFSDRSAGGSATIGLTAQRLVQYTPLSVLMVKGQRSSVRKILAGVAGDDEVVTTVAAQLAGALGATLQFLHVVPAEKGDSDTGPIALDEVLTTDAKQAGVLRNILAQLEVANVDAQALQVRRGVTADVLLDVAQAEQHDLIVVGGQSGAGFFLGSAANAVVRHAPQSVLVVRTTPH